MGDTKTRTGEPTVLVDKLLDEEIHHFELACGLPVLVHLKPGFEKKFVVLGANFGSVDRSFVDRRSDRRVTMPEGVAHFLEHKLFETPEGDAFEKFSRHGASANASTSFRSTCFFFTCSSGFSSSLRTLLRLVTRPHLTDRGIEKERGIIAQEIRMYEDSPDWRCFIHLVQGLFVRHPVRTDITGTVDSIDRIDRDALLTCVDNFYDPANLCLVVSGDVDPETVAKQAAREFSRRESGEPVVRLDEREPRRVSEARVEETLAVKRPKLLVGFKDRAVPRTGEDLQRRDLLTGILLALLFGSSSERYRRLYEKGTIDDSFYPSYAGDEDFGFVTLGGESDDPERMRAAIFREIRQFGREGFDTEDFGRIIHKMMGRFVRSLDSQESTAFLLLNSTFKGMDALRVPAMIRTLSPDDVMERHSELFGERNHCTSIVRPA